VLASRLRRDGPSAALEVAFGARAGEIEREWRGYLRRLSERRLDDEELGALELPPNELSQST
jgi:hypothetical protein